MLAVGVSHATAFIISLVSAGAIFLFVRLRGEDRPGERVSADLRERAHEPQRQLAAEQRLEACGRRRTPAVMRRRARSSARAGAPKQRASGG